jgi:hypothetical protein
MMVLYCTGYWVLSRTGRRWARELSRPVRVAGHLS